MIRKGEMYVQDHLNILISFKGIIKLRNFGICQFCFVKFLVYSLVYTCGNVIKQGVDSSLKIKGEMYIWLIF